MRFWLSAFLSGLLLLGGCIGESRGTADDNSLDAIVGNAYRGLMINADLSNNIRIIDRSTSLVVTFGEGETLRVSLLLSGRFEYRIGATWHEFDGTDEMEVQNLVVFDETLNGTIVLENTTLVLDASFREQRRYLDVNIGLIGSMTLTPWSPPPEEEGDDDDSSEAE